MTPIRASAIRAWRLLRAALRAAMRAALLAGAMVATVAVSVSGCGFQLRGSADALPFERFHTSLAANSQLGGDLRRAVRASGAQVVDRAVDADVVLQVLAESEEREISAFSTSGRTREYLLRLRVQYRITDGAGRRLASEDEILARRRLSVSDALGTVNADEAALLYRDMRADVVQQLMRRLAAVKAPSPARPGTGQAAPR